MNKKQTYIAGRILLTLAYTEQFDFALTSAEIYERLLVNYRVSYNDFLKVLKILEDKKLINKINSYYFIKGINKDRMVYKAKLRETRLKISKNKREEVNRFLLFVKKLPFVTGVAITGSLAVNNAVKDDDIDFMIVTATNRLWLTRLIVVLFSSFLGKRRSFAKEEKNSWCFNLWVEESDLQLPINSRSVYEAYEVIQADWILSRNRVASRFRSTNFWTNGYLMQSYDFNKLESGNNFYTRKPVLSEILDMLNLSAYYFQFLYMKHHMTREKVSKTHAFFHPRDTKSEVFNNWKKTLLRLL